MGYSQRNNCKKSEIFHLKLFRNHFRFSSVQLLSVSESLWPHGPQHARPPLPSPTPRDYSNSCPLSWWCNPTISSSVVPFSSCLQSFPASVTFPMSQLHIRWLKYWSFSISSPSEYSGLISFRIDWLDLDLACPRDSQESSLAPHVKGINSSALKKWRSWHWVLSLHGK